MPMPCYAMSYLISITLEEELSSEFRLFADWLPHLLQDLSPLLEKQRQIHLRLAVGRPSEVLPSVANTVFYQC